MGYRMPAGIAGGGENDSPAYRQAPGNQADSQGGGIPVLPRQARGTETGTDPGRRYHARSRERQRADPCWSAVRQPSLKLRLGRPSPPVFFVAASASPDRLGALSLSNGRAVLPPTV
jgi:hypothetical protein